VTSADNPDTLYDEYLETLAQAQRSCDPIDWCRACSAWSEWLAAYRYEHRSALIESAIARKHSNVIDLTLLTGR
jgi:hypothetical protein